MPITVQYQPSAHVLGEAANLVGLGQYAQERDKFALGVDQLMLPLGERARQFDQQLAQRQMEFGETQGLRRDQFGEEVRQFDVGQDLRERTFGEGIRQFDEQQGLREDTLGQRQFEFGETHDLNQQRVDLQNEQFQAGLQLDQARLRQQNIQQLRSLDQQEFLTGQAQSHDINRMNLQAIINQRLQKDRLSAQLFSDQSRFGQQAAMQMQGQQYQMQAAQLQAMRGQAAAEWQSLLKVLPNLPEDEQSRLIEQFNDKWQSQQLGMPIEFPDMQLPPDPMQQLREQEFGWKQQQAEQEATAQQERWKQEDDLTRWQTTQQVEATKAQRQQQQEDREKAFAQSISQQFNREYSSAYRDAEVKFTPMLGDQATGMEQTFLDRGLAAENMIRRSVGQHVLSFFLGTLPEARNAEEARGILQHTEAVKLPDGSVHIKTMPQGPAGKPDYVIFTAEEMAWRLRGS